MSQKKIKNLRVFSFSNPQIRENLYDRCPAIPSDDYQIFIYGGLRAGKNWQIKMHLIDRLIKILKLPFKAPPVKDISEVFPTAWMNED